MMWFQRTLPILAAILMTPPASAQLVPPGQGTAEGVPKSKLTAKDNDKTVIVPGDRFVVALPHRSRFQWVPLPRDAAAAEVAPRELEGLRKFEPAQAPGQNHVGAGEIQVSTFELPAKQDRPIKLELVYTDLHDPSKVKGGELYKPAGDDLSVESNRPRPNMRFVVTLKRG